MVLPLILAVLGAGGILAILLGGAGAFAIIKHSSTIIYIIGGIIGIYIIKMLMK